MCTEVDRIKFPFQWRYSYTAMKMTSGYVRTSPRKIPSQGRSRAAVQAILEAAARILESADLERLTTNEIAEVAGVSTGTLYQYFPNKSAIITALVEREVLNSLDAIESAVAMNGNGTALRFACEAAVRSLQERPRLSSALLAAEPLMFMDGEKPPFAVLQFRRFELLIEDEIGCGQCVESITSQLLAMLKGLLLNAVFTGKLEDQRLPSDLGDLAVQFVAKAHKQCGARSAHNS